MFNSWKEGGTTCKIAVTQFTGVLHMLIPVSNSYVCQLSVSCLNTYLITAGTARNQQLSMMTAAVDTLMLWGLEVD